MAKIKNSPVLIVILGLVFSIVPVNVLPLFITIESDFALLSVRCIASVVAISVMILLGVGNSLKEIKEGFRGTLRHCRLFLIAAFVVGCLTTAGGLMTTMLQGIPIPVTFFKTMLVSLIICIIVGIFEEVTFRGYIFQGLLKGMGKTTGGIMGAAVISAFIFGFVHIIRYLMGGSFDLVGAIQSVLKVIQVGMLGFALAGAYAKYRNLWALAFIHMLNDFFPMISRGFRTSSSLNDIEYVASGSTGVSQSIIYFIFILVYIPAVVSTVKLLKSIEVPQNSIYD